MDASRIREALATIAAQLDQAPSPTVREVWQKWADVHQHRLSDFATERGRAEHHLLPFFGDRPADSLTVFDVEAYRNRRRADRKMRGGKPTRPGTRNREVDLLNRVLNFCAREGLIAKNPIAHVEAEPEGNIQHTKIETEAKLEAITAEASPLIEALCVVLFETGARSKSEVYGLRWDQLDGDYLVFPRTKNREPRRAKLAPRALAVLQALPRHCEWIFANPATGRPYNPRHLSRLFQRAVEASGLVGVNGERITPHKLRHGFAYRCRRTLKLPERAVMKMGGWKTDVAFQRYGIVDEAETEEAWNVVALAGESLKGLDRKPPRRVPLKVPDDEERKRASRI